MTASLSPGDRERLENLFDRAAELVPAEQAAFLEEECGENEALRAELALLLAGLAAEDRMASAQAQLPSRAGSRIGPYRLLEKIGEGGMGEVYAAEQRDPVNRRVALKVIKPGMDSAQVVARFEAERQALARMAHPNIAQVFDAGATDDGLPYFVMELVAGHPITTYCDQHKLSTRERLELLLAVCDGVQHAHQKGIIHRDLKPSNLLVIYQDGRAVPKIIDFGVARATTGRLAERTLHTMAGQIVGTLDYMSPEQADPTGLDIDTRSDIYSLGVVLYQLVSGFLPFDHTPVADVPLSEVQRVIRDVDPPTPSTRFRKQAGSSTAVAPLHGTDERTLARQLAGDLDWICLKALEKDPSRRYATASELAEDVRRHLAHEPVLAGRPGRLYRARKFVRRNRVGVAAGVLVAGAGLAGVFGFVAGRLEARASARIAEALRPQADAHRLGELVQEADRLWPAHPHVIPAFEDWLDRARAMVSDLPVYRRDRDEIRSRAKPLPTHTDDRSWDFESDLDSARHRVLVELIDELEGLTEEETGLLGAEAVSEEHGWSVPKRLAFAEELEVSFAEGGEARVAWARDLPKIRECYPGLDLEPQPGLLPLGPDPASGLWEFAHLETGEPAVRGVDEELVLEEETGLVFVLLRGGPFWMGAQGNDPDGPNYDSHSTDVSGEGPPHEVLLSAFFLSKYEMTQGQWQRVMGVNPSFYYPGYQVDSLTHPVEMVSCLDCMRAMGRMGLSLPSEAQWEYGTRGDTRSVWWTGPDRDSLQGAVNLNDPDLDDGYEFHAPVNEYRANAFGLHNVLGNVKEWCLDGWDGRRVYLQRGARDPLVPPQGSARIFRGGGWRDPAGSARATVMEVVTPPTTNSDLGVRPARRILPDAPEGDAAK